MQEINKLIEEIDQLQEQLSVCQESFFPDEEEIEALEESIKEKVGQLGNKMREKFYDLAAKRFRNAEKIQKEIDKCERFNEAVKNELEKREIDGESLLEKAARLAWYSLVGNMEKFFSPGLRMTRRLKNVLKFNNMWMTALNKREAELKAKNGEGEAPAQEAMDIKALLFDINTMQDELNIVKESLLPDDEEIEALEESLKEKVTEFGDKFNAKVYGAVCDIYRKPDGAINKKIAKVEKEIAKIEGVLKNREEERDRATVLRIVKQAAVVAIAPVTYSIIMNLSKNAQPSFLLKQTLRADKILLSKLNQRKAELESKGGEEAPAQESAGLEFELEFLDDEE